MKTNVEAEEVPERKAATPLKQQIKWSYLVLLIVIHLIALYAIAVVVPRVRFVTFVWNVIYGIGGGLGVTAGAHRYWTHKSYKAKLPLRILLAALYLMTGMNPIFHWVRDHRVHHKFSETDADPHNARRGLFFSHVGWLMLKKHPEVLRRGKQVDMSDVLVDPVVQFQEKYFTPLLIIFTFLIPICVPCLLWDETWWISFFGTMVRLVILLNIIWSINSFAHIYGQHPYNRHINAADNSVLSAITLGEGWHNYHHTFPWDYKTSELGDYGINIITAFVDFFAYIGWAYDLKQPSKELVQRVVQQLGDGSHTQWGHAKEVPEEGEQLKDNVEELLLKAEEKAKGI